jgi:hypothetical protein
MSSRRFLAVVGAVAPLPRIAFGAEFVNRCVDLAAVRAAIRGDNGKLIEITPDQWQFLRGIYAMNLETPPGLPCGDEAVLAHVDGEPDGLVFFVDGEEACTRCTRRAGSFRSWVGSRRAISIIKGPLWTTAAATGRRSLVPVGR